MAGPSVSIDLDKTRANARSVTRLCADHGIQVTGVTKVTCGMPQVARAMLEGGVAGIGESRLENIHRLQAGGIVAPITLLRVPPLSGAEEIVASVDMSLNSEISVVQALARAAEKLGRVHEIILMVDIGDLREGFWPDDLLPAAREINEFPGVRIAGIGTNLSCYGGVLPTEKNMRTLVDHARRIEDTLGLSLGIISGGNSSSLPLVASGKMPPEVNQLRIGEAILLGRETIYRKPWPGTVQDAFVVSAEVIELKEKPSVPIGATGQDAFGHKPRFADKGERLRAILNIGREDVDVWGLQPVSPGVTILGASSDHLILDAGEASTSEVKDGNREAQADRVRLGEEIRFLPNYSALLAAMTSGYVEKRPTGRDRSLWPAGKLLAVGASPIFAERREWDVLESLGYTTMEFTPKGGPDQDLAPFLNEGFLPVLAGREPATVSGFSALSRHIAYREEGVPGVLWFAREPDIPRELLASELTHREALDVAGVQATRVSSENLVFLCLQHATPRQQDMIRRLRIKTYTMEDVDLLGIREVVRNGLRKAASGTRGLYVRFDPRCADNGRDGLSNREVHLALELVALSGLLRGFDVSGYVPAGSREVKRLRHFVLSALGKRILSR